MEPKADSEIAYFYLEVEGRRYLNSKRFTEFNRTVSLSLPTTKAISYGEILDTCLQAMDVDLHLEPTTISSITLFLPDREPQQNIPEDNSSYEGEREC